MPTPCLWITPAATVCGARTARRALRADPRAFSTAAPTTQWLFRPQDAPLCGDLVPHFVRHSEATGSIL